MASKESFPITLLYYFGEGTEEIRPVRYFPATYLLRIRVMHDVSNGALDFAIGIFNS